ncbi:MAG: NFACT family protein [Clostridia bacterium]|nr:NFACT family protein [Clostridia bacterium]
MGMGSDLFALSALADELNLALKGARIDKIQQPEVDELRFFVRNNGENKCLVVSCNANAPRIHFTTSKKQNPKVAPNLCMLLRKYLVSANIAEVKIYNLDRILSIKFNAKTEMKDDAVFFLFVEIMNRYSNIVFTDENLVILDAVKHLPLDIARDHVVLRGVKYSPVSQKKTSYLTDCFSVFENFNGGDLHKFMLDNLSGFSGATAEEFLFRSGLETTSEKLTQKELEKAKTTLEFFQKFSKDSPEFAPCIINDKEVYPCVYKSLDKGDNVQPFKSMSEAYDAFYTDSDKDIRNKARLKSLATQAKHFRVKVEKNITNDLERLAECEDMDKYRVYGELIVANIYKLKRGDEALTCFDYYANEDVTIPLNVQLTPSKNSAAYYAKYNKLKRTKEFVEQKLVADRELLEYALSIENEIAELPYEADVAPIEEELAMLGGGKRVSKNKKVRKEKAEPPYIYLVDGFYIYRGKNNLQNDELTFSLASSNDLWLHLKNEHGAHTVIITEGKSVPDKVLKIAAEITASTKNASCEVDYTQRKNVKRKPNGHPGQVIYVNYKTAVATPDAHEEFLVKH